MGRRQGTEDEKVCVMVSSIMADLRKTQSILNKFVWSTELSYAYILDEHKTKFPDPDQRVVEILGHLTTQAWYPNNQGRIKFDETIGRFLHQVTQNTINIYRAVLVYFTSAFEHYLERRVGPIKKRNSGSSWGPYLTSLGVSELCRAKVSVRLKTVICADICRLIRNRIIHPPFSLPLSLSDDIVASWRNNLLNAAQASLWNCQDLKKVFDDAFSKVIGEAVNHVSQASTEKKDLPIELFYMLFTLTNLDTLALEIEEALLPEGFHSEAQVWTKAAKVRRRDLITEQIQSNCIQSDRQS